MLFKRTIAIGCVVGGAYMAGCRAAPPSDAESTAAAASAATIQNGYFQSGQFQGYAYTFANPTSDISPQCSGTGACFSNSGGALCTFGTVGPSFSDYAALGVNVDQALNGTMGAPFVATGAGLFFDVVSELPTGLRVQLTGPNGATDPNERWCAALPQTETGIIPWTTFNTTCWQTGGLSFIPGTPITAVDVLVPGNPTPTSFDFCLRDLRPAAAATIDNGFFSDGPFQGYAFAFLVNNTSASSISPLCPADGSGPCFSTSGPNLCTSGVLEASPTFAATALLGVALNQPRTGGLPGTWTSTGSGLAVSVQNPVPGLRIQVQGPNGATDPSQRWCAPLPAGGSGVVPWSAFNTTCWSPTPGGAFPVGTPLSDAFLVLPSTNTASIPFNFCLTGIEPAP
jgi:hypothetical protein